MPRGLRKNAGVVVNKKKDSPQRTQRAQRGTLTTDEHR
jgi:hypothetical protein